MVIRQLNIDGRTYYFYNDLINIKNFNNNNLKIDKKSVLGNDVYYIGYITKKPQWNVNSVNPLCLMSYSGCIFQSFQIFISFKNCLYILLHSYFLKRGGVTQINSVF